VTRILQRCCLVLLLGFAGMALAHPAVAKGEHGHGRVAGKSAGSKSAPGGKTGAHTPPESGSAASKSDVNSPPSTAPVGRDTRKFPDKAPGANDAGAKPKIPQVSHNPLSTAPPNTVTRNAIGMAVTIHGPASNAAFGPAGEHLPNAPGALGPGAKPVSLPVQHPAPVGAAGPAASGKIGGASLIRPALAPAALGGPAKPSGGINGSTMRLRP
jgi:hypothetical protein